MDRKNPSTWVALGAILAALAVIAGAFGAHGLHDRLSAADLSVFETAARYHLIHAVGLIAVGVAQRHWPSRWLVASAWLLLAGVVLFSGSLYVLALTGTRWLGAVTPLGGVSFIAGWVALAVGALRG
jgi:uncharacterized membrane protein YgdD (TMEM256/DUF423 family)